MPLGNLTSQFFANVYLNELDKFIKHKLKAKNYLRYVDDFVILHYSKDQLKIWKEKINEFLKQELKIELHPDKSNIKFLKRGIDLLGFRIFKNDKLIRKRNLRNFKRKLIKYKLDFESNKITYEKVYESFQGFLSHTKHTNNYKVIMEIKNLFEEFFIHKATNKELDKYFKFMNNNFKTN